jgi:hypothetical protein
MHNYMGILEKSTMMRLQEKGSRYHGEGDGPVAKVHGHAASRRGFDPPLSHHPCKGFQ